MWWWGVRLSLFEEGELVSSKYILWTLNEIELVDTEGEQLLIFLIININVIIMLTF
jgi:hypothetical protein